MSIYALPGIRKPSESPHRRLPSGKRNLLHAGMSKSLAMQQQQQYLLPASPLNPAPPKPTMQPGPVMTQYASSDQCHSESADQHIYDTTTPSSNIVNNATGASTSTSGYVAVSLSSETSYGSTSAGKPNTEVTVINESYLQAGKPVRQTRQHVKVRVSEMAVTKPRQQVSAPIPLGTNNQPLSEPELGFSPISPLDLHYDAQELSLELKAHGLSTQPVPGSPSSLQVEAGPSPRPPPSLRSQEDIASIITPASQTACPTGTVDASSSTRTSSPGAMATIQPSIMSLSGAANKTVGGFQAGALGFRPSDTSSLLLDPTSLLYTPFTPAFPATTAAATMAALFPGGQEFLVYPPPPLPAPPSAAPAPISGLSGASHPGYSISGPFGAIYWPGLEAFNPFSAHSASVPFAPSF
ncbi:unnamed protein product, partial [Protopolystoma xenopodis]